MLNCFAGMSGYFYQYITVVVRDFIFFYDDVQSTTIAVAIASSLCCSIVWAICHLLTLGSSTCRSTKVNRSTFLTTNHAVAKSRRRMSPRNVSIKELCVLMFECACNRLFNRVLTLGSRGGKIYSLFKNSEIYLKQE